MSKESSVLIDGYCRKNYKQDIIQSILFLITRFYGTGRREEQYVDIFVKTLDGDTWKLKVHPLDTVHQIKYDLQNKIGWTPNQQRLILDGKQLTNSIKISEYGIIPCTTLYLMRR